MQISFPTCGERYLPNQRSISAKWKPCAKQDEKDCDESIGVIGCGYVVVSRGREVVGRQQANCQPNVRNNPTTAWCSVCVSHRKRQIGSVSHLPTSNNGAPRGNTCAREKKWRSNFVRFLENTQNISGPITFTLSSSYANLQGGADETGRSLGTNQEIDAAREHFAKETRFSPPFVNTGQSYWLMSQTSGAFRQAQC